MLASTSMLSNPNNRSSYEEDRGSSYSGSAIIPQGSGMESSMTNHSAVGAAAALAPLTATSSSGSGAASGNNVQVVCRVRPFNRRELELQADANEGRTEWDKMPLRSVIDMDGPTTIFLDHERDYAERQRFPFDISLWSIPRAQQESDVPIAGQDDVMSRVGTQIIHNVWQGFHSCIFAYGQTGSGKTYTMMGGEEEPGLIPRICRALFETIEARRREEEGKVFDGMTREYRLEARFFEIYNERVKDLLWALRPATDPADPTVDRENLKLRNITNGPNAGVQIVGLTCVDVSSLEECMRLIEEGTNNRSVGATKMNEQSSRSHSVFRLTLIQTSRAVPKDKFEKPKLFHRTSTISLVDLAGSERNKKTGAEGTRLREAVAINQSLTTLKNVIDALVENRSVVPYRDSSLTWILSDSLGGNSKTFMIACVSPHLDNAEESLNTLRYALRSQAIVCHATVNENDELRKMSKMKEELERLQRERTGTAAAEGAQLRTQRLEIGQSKDRMRALVDSATAEEEHAHSDLISLGQRRHDMAYGVAFRGVFQQRLERAYAAYLARHRTTCAAVDRELQQLRREKNDAVAELTTLQRTELIVSETARRVRDELERQQLRIQDTSSDNQALARLESDNAVAIDAKAPQLTRAAKVARDMVQRQMTSISYERELMARQHTEAVEGRRNAFAAATAAVQSDRDDAIATIASQQEGLRARLAAIEAAHKESLRALQEQATRHHSACIFLENENKRGLQAAGDGVLRCNKERFELFARTEQEWKRRLQELHAETKAALKLKIAALDEEHKDGQAAHDLVVDRIVAKARQKVAHVLATGEAEHRGAETHWTTQLRRLDALNEETVLFLRNARAAHDRCRSTYDQLAPFLRGEPTAATQAHVWAFDPACQRILAAIRGVMHQPAGEQMRSAAPVIFAVNPGAPAVTTIEDVRAARERQATHQQQASSPRRFSAAVAPADPAAAALAAVVAAEALHHAMDSPRSRGTSLGAVPPTSPMARAPSAAAAGATKTQRPNAVPGTAQPRARTPVASLKAPKVVAHQTASSRLRMEQGQAEAERRAASLAAGRSPHATSPGTSLTPRRTMHAASHLTPPSAAAHYRRGISTEPVAHQEKPPWLQTQNYWGYESERTNAVPIPPSQRVCVGDNAFIVMRNRTVFAPPPPTVTRKQQPQHHASAQHHNDSSATATAEHQQMVSSPAAAGRIGVGSGAAASPRLWR